MAYYIPPWLMGQQPSIGDPNSDFSQVGGGFPAYMTGAQPNIYAPQSNPYASAAPLSGGVPQTGGMTLSQLMNNPQLMSGIAALAGAGRQQQGVEPMLIRPPEPQVFDGRQYMPYLLTSRRSR